MADPDNKVELQAQYQAAWSEVNARIISRQNAFNSFVIAIGGIVALLTRDFQTAFGLSWLPAFVTITFTPWIVQNSLVIELLCRFCDACADYDSSPSTPDKLALPRWHSQPQQWFEEASRTRSSLDRSLKGIAFLCLAYSASINGMALYEVWGTKRLSLGFSPETQASWAILSALIGCGLSIWAIAMVHTHSATRKDMRSGNWRYCIVDGRSEFRRR